MNNPFQKIVSQTYLAKHYGGHVQEQIGLANLVLTFWGMVYSRIENLMTLKISLTIGVKKKDFQ